MAPVRARLGAGKALFEAFTDSASIPHFDAKLLPPTKPLASYNDDVVLEHYTSATRKYLGVQRRGIIGDHPDASSTKELVLEALSAKFFLAQKIPLPRSTAKAFDFLSK